MGLELFGSRGSKRQNVAGMAKGQNLVHNVRRKAIESDDIVVAFDLFVLWFFNAHGEGMNAVVVLLLEQVIKQTINGF